jgi:uncharacterized protein (DUF305 family)
MENRMIEAMKQALDLLANKYISDKELRAITALRQAIEQAEKQEPVAFETWLSRQHGDPEEIGFLQALKISYEAGQDSASPRKEWVGLDVEDCRRIRRETERDERENVIQMTETILREKNT